MPILKIEKEMTPEDVIYMSDALGYEETITKDRELMPMSMKEFKELSNAHKDKEYRVGNYEDESTVYVIETYTEKNKTSREDFLKDLVMVGLNQEIKKIMYNAEKQRLNQELQEKRKIIEEGIDKNITKTPLIVKVEE